MLRLSRHAAYHRLVKRGPWVDGSAHGFHPKKDCTEHPPDDILHMESGKYGQGYKHCIFCMEDIPFHKEYCPWYDFFNAWDGYTPLEVDHSLDRQNIPNGCKIGDHYINEA